MQRQISLAQYRSIDLFFLTALLGISEAVIYFFAGDDAAKQLLTVSTAGCVVTLVMMRWSAWAAVPAVLGGVLYVALRGTLKDQYLIYGGGNLFALVALLWILVLDKETIRGNAILSVLFGVTVQLGMLLGRALVAFILGYGVKQCLGFITADPLSILFTAVSVWIMRRIEGLFEDQKHYLLRIQQERQVEGREQF